MPPRERLSVYDPTSPSWQLQFMRDLSPVVLLHGTAGSGKSRACGEKAHAFAMRYPGSSLLFCRKTESSIRKSMLDSFESQVLDGTNFVRHIQNKGYIYQNGSKIYYAGMANEKERKKIRGIGLKGGLDFIWADEAIELERDDFSELNARMRGGAGAFRQICLSTNPGGPNHWIYKDLIEAEKASCYHSSYKDNKYNPSDYEDKLDMLTGVKRSHLKDGLWAHADGMVYDEFARHTHVIKPFAIPDNWKRIRSIDFGYRNPFVCQWWAIDYDGRMYLYREIYRTNELVEDMAALIKKLSGNEKISATITDHDAEGRATLDRHGIPSYPAFKDVTSGIEAVKARIKIQKDGMPRMMLFSDALTHPDSNLIQSVKKIYSTVHEFPSYVYEKPKEGRSAKEEPLKEDDHGMDAMRYAVAYIDKIDQLRVKPIDSNQIHKIEGAFSDVLNQYPRNFF